MRSIRMLIRIAALIGLFISWSASSFANGGLFFEEHHDGTLYFGTVKDSEGKSIQGATIFLMIAERNRVFSTTTDWRGRYRSTDVALDLKPTQVDVSMKKEGYQLVKKISPNGNQKPGDPMEVNFTVKRLDKGATR